eukprot:TRINITY_DN10843_c0_g1_i1.p1 TRINITY_DN10843_c0_g1~~TRINITY_DN10843_c0_g1_i1.p1  ORF type:complete len:352 (-),score=58.52 TRINITY_DN10843_c0_g1_i1:55-1110(-)
MALYRRRCANVLVPEVSEAEFTQAERTARDLVQRIDGLLRGLGADCRWFVKTNRHSCKDSPIDHPSDADIEAFRQELHLRGIARAVPIDTSPDDLDFGPVFGAFCSARLRATAASTGDEVLSLLARSHRTHDDLELQLSHCDEWDCYLAFLPFVDSIASTPLNEFRCYVSRGQLRCVAQYSYLVSCPIPAPKMADAGQACVDFVMRALPSLPAGVVDVAVDVRCIEAGEGFEVSLIEVNPLGPGCVWGVVDWDKDQHWLMGRSPLPAPKTCADSEGNVTQYVLSRDGAVLVGFTSEHARGFTMGGLSHMPAAYMAVLNELWELERLFERERNEQHLVEAKESKKGIGCCCQ